MEKETHMHLISQKAVKDNDGEKTNKETFWKVWKTFRWRTLAGAEVYSDLFI